MGRVVVAILAWLSFVGFFVMGWTWPIIHWLWTNVHYPYWFGS